MIKKGKVYKHYKGNLYRVLDIAKCSETLQDVVVYECLYKNDLASVWIRPLQMFAGDVEVEGIVKKRFQLMDNDEI